MKDSHFPPGLIGVASNTMGRYREFDISLRTVSSPDKSVVAYEIGCDIAFNFNNLCRRVLKDNSLQWLWVLGDDHIFKPDTLTKLLERNVNIVTPLCLKRSSPFQPVIYKVNDGKHYPAGLDYIKNETGLFEVDACGNAGMLIRRNVIEEIADDWHRVGWLEAEHGGSDLYFCKRARDHGFKLYVDLDNPIGHIAHMAVWPMKNEQDHILPEYVPGIREALDLPGGKFDRVDSVSMGDASDINVGV